MVITKFNVLFQNMKKKMFLIEIINYDIQHSNRAKNKKKLKLIYIINMVIYSLLET